jgi:hypothetical protein
MLERRPFEAIGKDDFIISVGCNDIGEYARKEQGKDDDTADQTQRLLLDKTNGDIDEHGALFPVLDRPA